jgi:hypothetical protein
MQYHRSTTVTMAVTIDASRCRLASHGIGESRQRESTGDDSTQEDPQWQNRFARAA